MLMNSEQAPAAEAYNPATWRGVRRLIGSDMDRMATYFGGGGLGHRLYWGLLPNFQALMWYRIYRCLMLKRRVWLARLLSLVSLYVNRVELSPTATIGPACLITHTGGSFYGTAGARLTIMGTCGAGPWGDKKDVGAGVGYPLIGDDVVLAQLCAVLGPVRIGHGAHIGPGTVVMRDVPPGAVVVAARSKILRMGERTDEEGSA
jgi:serine O-acetyltransferase